MSQQPDLTIPFDASVVDEETLRALRAVQRTLPLGDGGADGILVGGVATAAMFGTVQGTARGGPVPGPHEVPAIEPSPAITRQDEPLRPLELSRPDPSPGPAASELPEPVAPALSPAPSPRIVPGVAVRHGSSDVIAQEPLPNGEPMVSNAPQAPSEQPVVATPPVARPPEDLPDFTASAPVAQALDAEGDEDRAIALHLTAALSDTDGSETLSVTILGVPDGAVLSHGRRNPDGSWSVDASDVAHLTLTPPHDFSGRIDLILRVTSHEGAERAATSESTFTVTVNAVADAPSVTAADAQGREDTPVALAGLGGSLRDTDGSESLGFVLSGVPEGATLSAGTDLGGGRWALGGDQLSGLVLNPPLNFSGTIDLTLHATSRESSNGSTATAQARFQVYVDGEANAPHVAALDVTGTEDEAVALRVSAALADTDGSERLSSVTITGLPSDASLSHGSRSSDGSWVLDAADLPHLVLTPPRNYSGTIDLTVHVTSQESANGSTATTDVPFKVHVNAVADAPEVRGSDAAGKEDDAIPLNVGANLTDTDGSEVLSVVILNVPEEASLNHGTRASDGTWIVDPADLADLKITPPRDFSGTIDLTLKATARESSNGSLATSGTSFKVQVNAVADAPRITAHGASGHEDSTIPLNLSTKAADRDGSEAIASVIISGVPAGFDLTHGTRLADGTWKIDPAELSDLGVVPPKNYSGTVSLTVEVTSRESSNGSEATSRTTFPVRVEAVPDQPNVGAHDASGREDTRIALDISAGLTDTDGSEVLSVVIKGLPSGTVLSAGTKNKDGSWTLTPAQLSGLTMTPPANWSGSKTITVEAHSRETSNNLEATNSTTFRLEIEGVADAPTITPKNVSGDEDTAIPLGLKVELVDRDGSESLTVVVSGVPAGAVLSHGHRNDDGTWSVDAADVSKLTLTPPDDFSGKITLTVHATSRENDGGTALSEKSFTVTVNPVADAPAVTASDVTGQEDQAIALKLTAALTDTDGSEVLSVAISGVPEGASLSAGTRNADGSWSVAPADLSGLALTPPEDFSGTIDLTIRATSQETSNEARATTEVAFHVQVDAVADEPGLRVSPAVGDEDAAIPLHVSAWTTDRDNSESIVGFRLADVPDGAVVMAGGVVLARDAGGNVQVPPDAIDTLTIIPPAQSDADFTLRVYATSAEPNGDRIESAPADLPVTVRAVADAPTIVHPSAAGLEDKIIPLHLEAATADTDGSETITFVISNVPDGALLSEGTYRGPGIWSLTAEEAARATLLPPADYSGTIELKVTAIAQEGNGGDQKVTTIAFPVHVGAVVDTPAVGGLGSDTGRWGTRSGNEDEPIALGLDPGLSDRDGSETIVGDIVVSGVPEKAVLKLADGTVIVPDADGHYRIPSARMAGVTLTMPPDSDEKATLTIQMTVEDTGGVRATVGGRMVVDPLGRADAPTLELDPSNGTGHNSVDAEDGWIPLHISADVADKDGSETLSMLVRDVPEGASLSDGSPVGGGVWLVPVASLSGLSLRPRAGFSGIIDLQVTAIAVEREGDQQALTESVRITVTAPGGGGDGSGTGDGGTGDDGGNDGGTGPVPKVAQQPTLILANATTSEDNSVELSIKADLADSDSGSEALGIRIQGVPEGARLSAGIKDSETGDWLLRPADLAKLQLIPPPDLAGTITLTVNAVAQEATGDQATATSRLDVTVTPVADAAHIGASPAAGVEDQAVALDLDIRPGDRDGSETITSVVLSDPTGGATIADGPGITDNGDGTWTVDLAHLGDVRVVPPANGYGTFEVTVRVTTRETANGHTTTTTKIIAVDVAPEADAPTAFARDASGREDGPIAVDLSARLNDSDGSEVLSIVIEGLPAGARLSAGVNNGDGSWTLTPGQLSGLAVIPPADWSGTMDLTMHAYARERSNGSVEERSSTFQVHVEALADAPVVSARDVSGDEDSDIPLNLSAALVDRDGSEALTVVISGLPEGAVLSHGTPLGNDSWSVDVSDLSQVKLTPPPDFSGRIDLTMHVTASEKDGGTATSETSFVVQVSPVADAPSVVVADAHGREDAPVALAGLGAALRDTDGSESLGFVLSGVPEGATLSAGTGLGGGRWALTAAQLTGLVLNPPENAAGSYVLTLTAVASERGSSSTASTPASFTVTLDPVADEGTIGGSNAGAEDHWIVLQPVFATPDPDGSERWSETTTISGVPAGAVLSQGTEISSGVWEVSTSELQAGLVSVKPPANSDGDFDLTLTARLTDTVDGVSDSRIVSGSHAVSVSAVADAPAVTASDVTGQEDQAISLKLTAALTDTDGSEVLSVAISGVPEGASLSAGTRNADGSWSVAPADLSGLALTPPKDFSGTIALTIHATAKENATGETVSTGVDFHVQVHGVADAPLIHAADVSGQEDHAIPLDLSAALSDADGSEQLSSVILSGVPEGFMLSHGTMIESGQWQVPVDMASKLQLMPPRDWNGTLQLVLHATSVETVSGSTTTASTPFTVDVASVNDAPELMLTAPDPSDAGAPSVSAVGSVQAQDIDSTDLGGATVTLSSVHPGDRLDLEGFALHSENGHVMIGDTGIELVGGGYDAATGTLTLSGNAPPDTYAAVLKALVLESNDASGLAAGARSIGVTVLDSEGALSVPKTIDVIVDEAAPPPHEIDTASFAAASSGPSQDNLGTDVILLIAESGQESADSGSGSWTEHVDQSPDPSAVPHDGADLDQPSSDHVQPINDFHVDIGRVHWS